MGKIPRKEAIMSVDWKQPFEIAFQMLVAIVGWGLVALVALFGLAIVYSLIKAFFDFFTKKPKKSKLDDTYQKLMKDFNKTKNLRVVKDEE
jgi:hypothetical protein